MRKTMPTKYQIMMWWMEHHPKFLVEHGVTIDGGEPKCWCCDCFTHETEYTESRSTRQTWNEEGLLQRCHIIPRSLGGSNEPENLFLLCRQCHDNAPDVIYREMFFDWLKSYRKQVHTIAKKKFDVELDAHGINDERERRNLFFITYLPQFYEWTNGKLGLHKMQSGYGGVVLKPSTKVAIARKYWVEELDRQDVATEHIMNGLKYLESM